MLTLHCVVVVDDNIRVHRHIFNLYMVREQNKLAYIEEQTGGGAPSMFTHYALLLPHTCDCMSYMSQR